MFYFAPGQKSDRPSVCPQFHRAYKQSAISKISVAIPNFGLYVHLRIAHTYLTSHALGMGHGQNVGLEIMPQIDAFATGGSVFHKHNYRYVSFMQYLFNCALIHNEDCDSSLKGTLIRKPLSILVYPVPLNLYHSLAD